MTLKISAKIFLLLFFMVSLLWAFESGAALTCSVCGKTIRTNYMTANNKVFCSQSCFNKTLPRCAICGKICKKAYCSGDKFYCSKTCLEKTFPVCVNCGKHASGGMQIGPEKKFYCMECAAAPRCFSCMYPCSDCKALDDGRYLCSKCGRTAIFDEKDALSLMNEVRQQIKDELGLYTEHPISLVFTDKSTLEKKSTRYAPGEELGLFMHSYTLNTRVNTEYTLTGKKERREEYRTNERNAIYILYGTPKAKMIEVIAHELAHDWMQKFYPSLQDVKVKEGWAEYIAWRVNHLYGNDKLNLRMENNTDPIYGEGFKMIRDRAEINGVDGLKDFFAKLNQTTQ